LFFIDFRSKIGSKISNRGLMEALRRKNRLKLSSNKYSFSGQLKINIDGIILFFMRLSKVMYLSSLLFKKLSYFISDSRSIKEME